MEIEIQDFSLLQCARGCQSAELKHGTHTQKGLNMLISGDKTQKYQKNQVSS